jgi:phosphoglycolate phosphatase
MYLSAFERIHLDRLTPMLGAEACLDALGAQCYLAIVSNKTGRLLRREVEALGWNDHFGQIVGAGDASSDKPNRAPIDLALAGSGIEAGPAVWYVGDTEIDVATAGAAGCISVLVHVDDQPRAVAAALLPQADYSFDGFSSMLATFRSWQT